MIYPSLASITFKELDVHEIIKICNENGVKAVEWASNCHVPQGNIDEAVKINKLCKENHIKIAGYGTYFVLGRETAVDFAEFLETAKALGAKLMRVWGTHEPTETMSKERRAYLIEQANVIAEMAQKEGIEITYEYHHGTLTDTLESTLNLLESTINTKTHWQKPIGMGVQECVAQIKALKGQIANIHVNNRDAVHWQYHPLADIKNEWISFLSELFDREGDDIFACIEFTENASVEQFKEDFAVLKDILNKLYEGK